MPAVQSKPGYHLAWWETFSSGNILKYVLFLYPPKIQVLIFHATPSVKVCIECQTLCLGNKYENIMKLSSVEFAQKVIQVKRPQ